MLDIFIYIVSALFVIASILMTLVILLQRPRSEGLGSAFGGGMTESLFGADTTDVLTKITIWLAVFFFAATMILAYLMTHKESQRGATTRELRTVAEEQVNEDLQALEEIAAESADEADSSPKDAAPADGESNPAPAPTPAPATP
jgi:preprotein translocase subunit SecG